MASSHLSSASLPLTLLYAHHLPALLYPNGGGGGSSSNNNNTALPHAPSIFHQLLDRQWGTAMASQLSSPTKVSHTNLPSRHLSHKAPATHTTCPTRFFILTLTSDSSRLAPLPIPTSMANHFLLVFYSQPQSLSASAGGRQRGLRQGQNSREERYWSDFCPEIYPQR